MVSNQHQVQITVPPARGQFGEFRSDSDEQHHRAQKADIVLIEDDDEQHGPMPDLLELSTKLGNVDYDHTKPVEDLLVHRGDTMQAVVYKSKKLAEIVQSGGSIAVATGRMHGPQDTPLNEWELCKQRFPSAEASIYERWARGATLPRMSWSSPDGDKDDFGVMHSPGDPSNETLRALKAIYKGDAPAHVTDQDVHNFLTAFPSLRPLLSAHVRLQRLRHAGDLPQLLKKQREDAEWRAARLATAQIEEELHALMSQAQKYKALVESNLRVLQHRMSVVGGATQEAMLGIGAIKMEEDLCEDLLRSSPPQNSVQSTALQNRLPTAAAPQQSAAQATQHAAFAAPHPTTGQVLSSATQLQPLRGRRRSLSVSSAPPTASAEMSREESPLKSASTPAEPFIGQSQGASQACASPARSQQLRKEPPGKASEASYDMAQDTQGSSRSRAARRVDEFGQATSRRADESFISFSGDGEREDEDGDEDEDEEELAVGETVMLVGSSPDRAGNQREQAVQQQNRGQRSQSPSPVTPGHPFQTSMEMPDHLRAIARGNYAATTEQRSELTQVETQSQTQTQDLTAPPAQPLRGSHGVIRHSSRIQHTAQEEDGQTSFMATSSKRSAEPVIEIEAPESNQQRSRQRGGAPEAVSSRKKTRKDLMGSPSNGAHSSPFHSDDRVEDDMQEDKENADEQGEEEREEAQAQKKPTSGSKLKTYGGGKGARLRSNKTHGISDLTNTGAGGGSSNRQLFQPASKT